ncbi:PHP domain-containing protein [Nocardioides mesophilus]|uniref:PHP domain-containing protein n=1 Tax=Nocardioides mesophilus TaxID=433659 RepID=UPI001CB702EF|nr:PHP domain-containing protein [Nocardioides mesophilus]
MPDPFVHLHVASGYSLQYGASHPRTLVERAVEHEMDTLALTDRDGTYGAVKFAKACLEGGIRPVLGVDLAIAPSGLVPPASGGRVTGPAVPAPAGPGGPAGPTGPRCGAGRSVTPGCRG